MMDHLKQAIDFIKSDFSVGSYQISRDNIQEKFYELYIDGIEIYFFIWKDMTTDTIHIRYWIENSCIFEITIKNNFDIIYFELNWKIVELNDLPVKNLLDITEEDLFYIKLLT